jgi:chitinase
VPLANGTGLCTDLSGGTPGCDVLLTPGLATYSTLVNLAANGYVRYFDPVRIAEHLYRPTLRTFYTYDDLWTATPKMTDITTKGLGGAYVWALKDDSPNGDMVKAMARGLGN